MLNQEQIHRYFNHLTGAKRIEFLYGLLHLCQPLELRYLGTCLEEIARKDYEYLYHAEQKTNHLPTQTNPPSSSASSVSGHHEPAHPLIDLLADEKLDLTDQLARAHAIVDIALLWAKNRACAIRLFRRLKASESVKLVDMLLERDDLDERTMDEILIIFCLAANHPAFSFDMRTQMSQILKDLEKRQRKMKLLQTVHNHHNDEDEALDDSIYLGHQMVSASSSSIQNASTLSVHASPLLTRLAVVNFDTDSTPMRVLIKADWSDNNSTLAWKTANDIRSFHLQLSNIVYHDDIRLERLMNISGYLRDIGSSGEPDVESMQKNIGIYITHLVYFSSYISTISTLAKFFNSSLKLVDSKQRLFNSNTNFDDSSPCSPSFSNGITPLQCELPMQQITESDSRLLASPKLSLSTSKTKQQTDVAKQARAMVSTHNGTQTGFEVRCEETQTDRMPGPGSILAEHQDYLRRYSMDELAKLTANDLVADGLDPDIAQLLCGALEDLKPMSVHLSNNSKAGRSPSSFIELPTSSASPSPPPLPPVLEAALMTVVQQHNQQEPTHTPPPGFDRNSFEHILINFAGLRPPLSSSPSPKLPKATVTTAAPTCSGPPVPPTAPTSSSSSSSSANGPPSGNQHHMPLLATHSFLYNPVESCIFPIAMPPGFPLNSPDFMRLFAPNMNAAGAHLSNTNNMSGATYMGNTNSSQGSVMNSRSNTQSNGSHLPPESNGQNPHHSSSSNTSRHPSNTHYRHRQHYPSDSNHFQQRPSQPQQQQQHHQQQQQQPQSQQQPHNRQKACYTCGDVGHLAFSCPEQYLSDSNYSHHTRDGYRLDYRPRQNAPSHVHHQQRQMRSNSNSKSKVRENS